MTRDDMIRYACWFCNLSKEDFEVRLALATRVVDPTNWRELAVTSAARGWLRTVPYGDMLLNMPKE